MHILTLHVHREAKTETDHNNVSDVDVTQTVEVHVLEPGDGFERFGGSSSGLVADKYGSLVTRTRGVSGSNMDFETYPYDRKTWAEILRMANHSHVTVEWKG